MSSKVNQHHWVIQFLCSLSVNCTLGIVKPSSLITSCPHLFETLKTVCMRWPFPDQNVRQHNWVSGHGAVFDLLLASILLKGTAQRMKWIVKLKAECLFSVQSHDQYPAMIEKVTWPMFEGGYLLLHQPHTCHHWMCWHWGHVAGHHGYLTCLTWLTWHQVGWVYWRPVVYDLTQSCYDLKQSLV